MSIRVGIHRNLVIAKTGKNEKGSLTIGVKKMVDKNPLEMLNKSTGSTNLSAEEHEFLIYPPKTTDFNGNKFDATGLVKEIANIVDPLSHIVLLFTTSDNLKWDILKGTGIVAENYNEKIVQPETLAKVYNNIVDQFIAMMKPYVGEQGKRLRGVFPRQSRAKHFPALRRRFLDRQPIFESMEVPEENSRIAFSAYEIEKGLNIPDQIIPTQVVSVEDKASADALFVQ